MAKIATSALLVLLVITFIMGVYNAGSGKQYSFWVHFQKIEKEFYGLPSFEKLASYWGDDSITVRVSRSRAGTNYVIYPEHVTDSDWGIFEPIQSFFGSVKGFCVRSYYTIVWICDFVIEIFGLIGVLLPWNGNVEVTA